MRKKLSVPSLSEFCEVVCDVFLCNSNQLNLKRKYCLVNFSSTENKLMLEETNMTKWEYVSIALVKGIIEAGVKTQEDLMNK